MSAASEVSGWLLVRTSSAAAALSVICHAVTAPNVTTSAARTAPMMRRRPGSVVAARRSWSTPSAKAVRRAGEAPRWWGRAWCRGRVRRRGCGGCRRLRWDRGQRGWRAGVRCVCHVTSPWSSSAASIAVGGGIRTGLGTILIQMQCDGRKFRAAAPTLPRNTPGKSVRFRGRGGAGAGPPCAAPTGGGRGAVGGSPVVRAQAGVGLRWGRHVVQPEERRSQDGGAVITRGTARGRGLPVGCGCRR